MLGKCGYRLLIICMFLGACGGGSGSDGQSKNQEQEIETFSTISALPDNPTISFIIDFANNFAREDIWKLSFRIDVATDGDPNNSGDEFTLFWNGESEANGCSGELFCLRYPFVDIVGYCCTVAKDVYHNLNNENGHLQVILNYHGAFTKGTFANLENGQIQYNIKVEYYESDDHSVLLSRDFYPGENSYANELGLHQDTLRDYEGNGNMADIASVEVILDLSRFQ